MAATEKLRQWREEGSTPRRRPVLPRLSGSTTAMDAPQQQSRHASRRRFAPGGTRRRRPEVSRAPRGRLPATREGDRSTARCTCQHSLGSQSGRRRGRRRRARGEAALGGRYRGWGSAATRGGGDAPRSSPALCGTEDLSLIQKLWLELKDSVSYLSESELEVCAHALQIAFGAHKGQKRKSGEPYIIHPVAVSCILGELQMDADSIVAGLLHDVVEDTDKVSFQDIEIIFGEGVRHIVEGETKVTKLKGGIGNGTSAADDKYVDMQQLFIAMTKEIRIIIVKLADRLHNMRTLEHMPPHKQKNIAQETLSIFAPLANLLGLHNIQDELEDLSFRYSLPDEYRTLSARVRALKMDQSPVVYEARQALLAVLEEDAFFQQIAEKVEVRMASRSLYNIHKKLKSNALSLRDLQNIAQLHVVATPKKDIASLAEGLADGRASAADRHVCYYLLSKVHAVWAPIPGKFKDFISTPKGNNYQALHTAVIPLGSKDLFPLEIQIRTQVMNMLADQGYAAHRRLVGSSLGKISGKSPEPKTNGHGTSSHGPKPRENGNGVAKARTNGTPARDLYTQEGLWQAGWLNAVKEWQQEFVGSVSAEEFVETVVGDFLPRSIFVFSADGTLVSLPKGSTVVDFAYQQERVGNQMLMAKVNGVPTHASHELKLAEVVEVVTHNGPPSQYMLKRQSEYLTYANSRSTRHKILKFLKNHHQGQDQAKPVSSKERKKSLKSQMQRNMSDSDLADGILPTPYSQGEVLWLILKCQDEVGLLANVASLISSSGVSIRAYSGSVNDYVVSNYGSKSAPALQCNLLMNFELTGGTDPDKLKELCDTIADLKAITGYAIGCNWSAPPS